MYPYIGLAFTEQAYIPNVVTKLYANIYGTETSERGFGELLVTDEPD